MDEFDPLAELIYGDEIEDVPSPEPLIDGVLDLDSTALLYGPSGSGKSFVALDWALSVAADCNWDSHDVVPGQVLYVVGEGLTGTRGRFMAWKQHQTLATIPNITWTPRAVNVLEKEGRDIMRAWVSKVQPTFTILDTLARHIPGGEENSFETISRVVEIMDWIRVETGGCALVVHHTGKDESHGARGHSSLKGAMDTEICCTRGPLLTVTKQKNHEDGHILGSYRLLPVDGSMVVTPKERRANVNDDYAVKALSQLGGEGTWTDWKDLCVTLGMKPGSFGRTAARLVSEAILVTDTTDTSDPKTRYRFS